MVAGFRCCQTWIEHPMQSDHASPRSDLHPHIFATKARWRGIAHGLAHLPQVLSVGSQSHSHCSFGVLAIAQMDCSPNSMQPHLPSDWGFNNCFYRLSIVYRLIFLGLSCPKLSKLRRSRVILLLMLFYYHVERTWKWNKQHDRMVILYRNWTHSANMGWLQSSILLLLKSYCGQLVNYVMRRPRSWRGPQEIHGQNRSPVQGFKIAMCFSCGTDGRWKMQFEMSWSAKMGNYATICQDLCEPQLHPIGHEVDPSTRTPLLQ